MDREIAQLNFDGKLQAVAQNPETSQQTLSFGPWNAVVTYGLASFGSQKVESPVPNGGALVAQLGPDEFLVMATHARVEFQVADRTSSKQRLYLRVEEGEYKDGTWNVLRLWNGDQTDFGLNFLSTPHVLRVRLATY